MYSQKIINVAKRIFFFPFFSEKKIWHNLFEISILVKGLNGFWEIALGSALLFFRTDHIYALSASTRHFIAVYFLFYGVVNIFLMVFLLKGKLWAYPAAITFFLGFTVYLCQRLYRYRSGLLLVFILFDVLFIFLTFLEYRRITWKQSL